MDSADVHDSNSKTNPEQSGDRADSGGDHVDRHEISQGESVTR